MLTHLEFNMTPDEAARRDRWTPRVDILYGIPIIKPPAVVMMAACLPDPEPTFLGITMHRSALATRQEVRVERHPTAKRRRRWRTVEHQAPCVLMTASAWYVHPDLWEPLLKALHEKGVKP